MTQLKPAAGPDASKEAMRQAWMKASMPGDGHRLLAPFAGTWDAKVKAYFAPGQPPAESTGRMVCSWSLDGRYLKQQYETTSQPAFMKGVGFWGHDNLASRFVGLWMDTMSTAPLVSAGDYNAATKSFDMIGDFSDPAGGRWKSRHHIVLVDDRTHRFEAYRTGADGREVQTLEVVYTRTSESR